MVNSKCWNWPLHIRSHVHLRHAYGTSLITLHFQHSTGTGSLHFLQVHRDFLLTLYLHLVYEWTSVLKRKPKCYASEVLHVAAWSNSLLVFRVLKCFNMSVSRLSMVSLGDMRSTTQRAMFDFEILHVWFYNSFAKVLHLCGLNI